MRAVEALLYLLALLSSAATAAAFLWTLGRMNPSVLQELSVWAGAITAATSWTGAGVLTQLRRLRADLAARNAPQ